MFNKIFKAIGKIEEAILAWSVIAMALMLIINVIMRVCFNRSLTFSEELGAIMLVVITYIGIGYCVNKVKHINMSALFDLSGLKVKKILIYITSLGSAIMMFTIAYLGGVYINGLLEMGRVTPVLGIPVWTYSLVLPIGFALGGIASLRTFILNVRHKEIYLSAEVIYQEPSAEPSLKIADRKAGEGS